MIHSESKTPRLPQEAFGFLTYTARISSSLEPTQISAVLRRHFTNDWGDLDPHDAEMNDQTIKGCLKHENDGSRIFSVYKDIEGAEETIYVITYPRMDKKLQSKPDYCNTTVMYASDY